MSRDCFPCTTGEGNVLLRVFFAFSIDEDSVLCVTVFACTTGEGNISLRDCFAFSTGEGNALLRDCFRGYYR